MAKLLTMFLILIAIQGCLILYADQTAQDTPIWNFVMNIENWSGTTLFVTLGAIALAIGLSGIASGGSFRFVTDFIVFAPAITGLLTIGVIFTNLASVIRDELIARLFAPACVVGASCVPANFIVGILIGPVAFFYAWTVCEWWRSPSS